MPVYLRYRGVLVSDRRHPLERLGGGRNARRVGQDDLGLVAVAPGLEARGVDVVGTAQTAEIHLSIGARVDLEIIA